MSPRKRRWLKIVGGLVVFLLVDCVGVIVGVQYYQRWLAQRDLDAEIAAVDAIDPRWRLEDIEADRKVVPPEQNSAVVTREAYALLLPKWDKDDGDFDNHPAPIALTPELAAKLGTLLKGAQPALDRARTIKDLPFGRHRLEYTPDFISTMVPDQSNARAIARLLSLDVQRAVHNKQMTLAWDSNRALLNVGRSLGDEPLMISPLIRLATAAITVESLERILAQGELAAAQLEERQQALDDEQGVPLFLTAIRGERAGNHQLLANAEQGNLSLVRALKNGFRPNAPEPTYWDSISDFFAGAMMRYSHATLLRYQTQMVEAAKLPPPERYTRLAAIDLDFREATADDSKQIMSRLLFTGAVRVAEAEQRGQTRVGCAVAGLAAERFRLKNARWPKSLDELVKAGLLKAVPMDRMDGKPLRYRHAADGIVIYSIGKEGTYNGTALDHLDEFNPDANPTEFRLWDLKHRRQTARPKD